MKIPVSELIVKFMERLGIEYIFGMPGAHILPVYDSLYDSTIKTVLAKHEQGASFMAGGYARASGKIGACITTAGPGATNLVTGIANAYADKQAILIITGETSTHIFGKGGLQESSGEGGSIDQETLFRGITRYNKLIERADYLPNVLNRAAKILLSDDSGPVLLSFPFNVQKELVDDAVLDHIKTEKAPTAGYSDTLPVSVLTDLIIEADNPIIIAGYGCIKSGAHRQVSQLSRALNIPVASSLKGKGVIDETSELAMGSLGVTSYTQARHYIVEKADLVIVLGASFNERTSYLWDRDLLGNKKVAQVDINFEQLEKVFKADVAIHGDIREVLDGVLENLKNREFPRNNIREVVAQLNAVSDATQASDAINFRTQFPLVEKFFTGLAKHFPDGIQVFDDNIIFAQNFFSVSSENRFYPNSGVSSLGHAIPAAIGARFSNEKPTFAVLGDGGFQMCCMELMTAVNYHIPLNVLMFNNATMGLIRKNQHQQYGKRFINCDFVNPDFRLLSQSFGINHIHVENEQDLHDLFTARDLTGAINLIEIMLDKDAFPTYQSGR